MRFRTFLLFALPLTLLISLPGVAVSNASDYRTSTAALRALWAVDIASGVPAIDLAPLQAILDASDSQAFVGVPIIVLNPSHEQVVISSLQARTSSIYNLDFTKARDRAILASITLARAIGSPSTIQTHILREELSAATTINDYSSLAAAWQLDALLVPLDRSLSSRQIALSALIAQANSLSVPSPDAALNYSTLTTYFNSDPTTRYATAPALIASSTTTFTALQSAVSAEIARRAEAARAAAEAARAAAAAAAAEAAARASTTNRFVNGTLYLYSNGTYGDCQGATAVRGGLYSNPCLPSHSLWLIGHKWSVGSLFFHLSVGSHIVYQGRTYTVYNIFTADPQNEFYGPNGLATENAPMRLETCDTYSGSVHLVIEAS